MSKQFDELTKNLAKGVSRRAAIWRFLTGAGAVAAGAVLSQKKAQAGGTPSTAYCFEYCKSCFEGAQFEECLAVSEACDLVDRCAVQQFLEPGVSGDELRFIWVCGYAKLCYEPCSFGDHP